jgi:precorrin-8X/cobalt-precorrin-8 methylmutase
VPVPAPYLRDPDQIYRASFEAIAAEADLEPVPPDLRELAVRLIHSAGMVDLVDDLAFSDGAGVAGRLVLAAGATVVTDVSMVAAGIDRRRLRGPGSIEIAVAHPEAAALARRLGTTRSAAGVDLLEKEIAGAVVAIGNAPTALFRLLELILAGRVRPALILGFPVGFVGAAESKEALIAAPIDIPYVTLRGRRGGSAMAVAAVNALLPRP